MNHRVVNLVSVIIPCYNKAQFLAEAIDSVLTQTYKEIEILVVNDGSLDNTEEVVARYPAVRYFGQQNQGVSAARNAGLFKSRGEFIIFLDADDRLLPDGLEVGIRCMKKHPECAFVSGHVLIIGADGAFVSKPEETCIQSDHYRQLLTYNYVFTPAAVMFRASVFDTMRGYSTLRSGAEDWELYLRIARMFPVYCHDKIVAEYRADGAMSGDPGRMLRDSLATLHTQRPYVKGKHENEKALQEGILTAQRYYGDPLLRNVREHLQKSEWKKAIWGAFMLFKYYPQGFRNLVFKK